MLKILLLFVRRKLDYISATIQLLRYSNCKIQFYFSLKTFQMLYCCSRFSTFALIHHVNTLAARVDRPLLRPRARPPFISLSLCLVFRVKIRSGVLDRQAASTELRPDNLQVSSRIRAPQLLQVCGSEPVQKKVEVILSPAVCRWGKHEPLCCDVHHQRYGRLAT